MQQYTKAVELNILNIFKEGITMMQKVLAVFVVVVLAVSIGACKKKEEKPQLPAGHPAMEGGMPPAGMPQGMPQVPKVERQIVVSKDVTETWKAVKLSIENKPAKTTKEYSVNIGSELTIPNTKMTVKVLAFLPDFKMTDKEFKSASNKPNMPAALISVNENGKEIWNNWLFSLQPSIHPFQHENVGIILVGGVAK